MLPRGCFEFQRSQCQLGSAWISRESTEQPGSHGLAKPSRGKEPEAKPRWLLGLPSRALCPGRRQSHGNDETLSSKAMLWSFQPCLAPLRALQAAFPWMEASSESVGTKASSAWAAVAIWHCGDPAVPAQTALGWARLGLARGESLPWHRGLAPKEQRKGCCCREGTVPTCLPPFCLTRC